jgi:uncharacterized protein
LWSRDPAVSNLEEILPSMVNPDRQLATVDEVRQGVQHILAELVAEIAELRASVRSLLWETGKLATSKNETLPEGQGLEYKDYFQFTEAVRQIPPHRVLAINRGERENALKVKLEFDADLVRKAIFNGIRDKPPLLPLADHPHAEFLKTVVEDALVRLVLPGLEREIRRDLTEEAQEHAVAVFARNLRSLLLQRPLRDCRVLAIDPGFRAGCRVAVLDETGQLLEHAVIYALGANANKDEARAKLEELIRKHQVRVIAIGNGNGCREMEELISELIAHLESGGTYFGRPVSGETVPSGDSPPAAAAAQPIAPPPPAAVEQTAATEPPPAEPAPAAEPVAAGERSAVLPAETQPLAAADAPAPASAETPAAASPTGPEATPARVVAGPPPPDLPPTPPQLAYVIVNEAGASVYATSPIGREEFPHYDAPLRATISLGRRLQDPLSELVKVDPHHVGVGLYQHDVHTRHLRDSLEAVIESCVNSVGVDLNSAGVALLRHVSGLNQLAARDLVEHRKQHGPFRNREQLVQVPSVGPVRYVQAAGFLRIKGGDNPLDRTWIHPESYPAVYRLCSELGCSPEALVDPQGPAEVRQRLATLVPEELAPKLELAPAAVRDLLAELAQPGKDPRDDLPPPVFRQSMLKLEDLKPGMELKGTVLNVVDFGAFVDVGLKDSGLVHISQLANRYVKSPYEVVSVGDVVAVWVLNVDTERHRVSLTMIPPGTVRRPPERKAAEGERPPRAGGRPPRGRKPVASGPPRGHGPIARPGQPAQPAAPASASPPAAAGATPPPSRPAARHEDHRPRRQPAGQPTPARPPQHPRPPQKPKPLPKLSAAALKGAVPLRTFGELEAFFKAAQPPPEAARPAAAPAPPSPPPPQPAANNLPADSAQPSEPEPATSGDVPSDSSPPPEPSAHSVSAESAPPEPAAASSSPPPEPVPASPPAVEGN